MYDVSLKRKWDTYATLNYAREEGKQEGKQEGRVEGRQEGRVEGRVEGRQEGREAKSSEVVENLISEFDLSNQDISKMAKVSKAFVQEIRDKIKSK